MNLLILVVLSLFFYPASFEYLNLLNYFHHFLSLMIVLDTFLKVLDYGFVRYFGKNSFISPLGYFWRKLEFLVTIISVLDFIIDVELNWFKTYVNSSISDPYLIPIRLFFTLRDIRVLLIIQEFRGFPQI
jgi:hypothetical protein